MLQPRTPLELEVAALLHGSDHVFTKEKPLSRAEERAMRAMSLDEVRVHLLFVLGRQFE